MVAVGLIRQPPCVGTLWTVAPSARTRRGLTLRMHGRDLADVEASLAFGESRASCRGGRRAARPGHVQSPGGASSARFGCDGRCLQMRVASSTQGSWSTGTATTAGDDEPAAKGPISVITARAETAHPRPSAPLSGSNVDVEAEVDVTRGQSTTNAPVRSGNVAEQDADVIAWDSERLKISDDLLVKRALRVE